MRKSSPPALIAISVLLANPVAMQHLASSKDGAATANVSPEEAKAFWEKVGRHVSARIGPPHRSTNFVQQTVTVSKG